MKKLLFIVALLFAIATPVSARARFQGYAERGGQTVITALTGTSVKGMVSYPFAQYIVLNSGTSTPATIYSDPTGTPKVCPCTTDATAFLFFYGDAAAYDVRFSGAGIAVPWTQTSFGGGGGGGSGGGFVLAPAPSGGDDYAAIQGLIDTYNPLDIEVLLLKGSYLVSAELHPANHRLLLRGLGQTYQDYTDGTIIRATTAMNSVIRINYPFSEVRNLSIDGNRVANYGVYFASGTNTIFDNVVVHDALFDGFHSDGVNLNQLINLDRVFSFNNGRLYATAGVLADYPAGTVRQTAIAGTASVTAGSPTVTFTGAPDLTTLGIRLGDILRVGTTSLTASWSQIASVTSNTITLSSRSDNCPTFTAAGQNFAIGIGWGWFEERNSGNGFNFIYNSVLRGNAAGNVMMGGLYGSKVRDSETDFSFGVGISMGFADNLTTMFQPVADSAYMEFGIGPDYLLGNITDGLISTPGGGGHIFSTGGGAAQMTVVRGGQAESQQFGAWQTFIFEFNNNAGTVRHRIIADVQTAFGSNFAYRLNGATPAWTNTPTVSSVVAFAGAAGIESTDPGTVLFDTISTQGSLTSGGVIEYDDAGITGLRASLSLISFNVNGVTISRPALRLIDATGSAINWSASLPAGKSVRVRISGLIK